MDRKSKDGMPRYQQIALDIATQIVKQQYKVGDRIYARSSLASKYHVSPETARRAICLLADMDIVEAEKGSGVVILSVDNAARYLQQLTGVETMTSLRQSIRQDLDNQLLLAQQLREKMSDLMDRAERFQHLNPFNPFEITGEVGSICEGKTLADVNFWQNTMATVIAISHNGELLISPGPHNRMQAGDIVYFVGDENAPSRVDRFLRGGR